VFLLLSVGAAGCAPSQPPGAVEDSLTSGRITVVCAQEALDVVSREGSAYQALYPEARIEIRAGTSQQALHALYGAECDVGVITRELSGDERAAAMRGGLELEGYRFARDALVAIVHPANPVENLALPELREVYTGGIRDWSQLGGLRRRIRPVVQPSESDVTAFFIAEVMGGDPVTVPVLAEDSDSAVAARVAREPDAVGYVTLAWAERGVRPLRLSALKGLSYLRPDPESVYEGQYPLTRFFNLYVRTGGRMLANGFVTYVTSFGGQKIVQDAGFVPTSVPVRFVRRSPMLQSH
jgi:phosphate transport system substrate-binding protein